MGLYTWLTVVFREPVKFVLVLAFALMVHVGLALVFLLFGLAVWLIGELVVAHYRRQGRLAMQRAAEHLALIQESLMLMRLVKVYLMELFNQSRVERQLSRFAGPDGTATRGGDLSAAAGVSGEPGGHYSPGRGRHHGTQSTAGYCQCHHTGHGTRKSLLAVGKSAGAPALSTAREGSGRCPVRVPGPAW